DPDVLDTWFSSALWTHSTLGWGWDSKDIAPEHRGDLAYFYPTHVMETAYDILFFWVARMIMMGIENLGHEPFHTIYLHGLVRDPHGMKMSKTRGNVVDPLQLIERYGTDALRFGLLQGSSAGNDSRINEAKLEASRNFVNKLWNASRFVFTNLEGAQDLAGWPPVRAGGWHDLPQLSHREDRWILSRLNRVAQQANGYLAAYQFGEAQQAIYEFLWGEFCDWYIEMAKIRLRAGDRAPLSVLAHVLEHTLRLLHPFTPFVTEELWQHLLARLPSEGGLPESIVIAPYPTGDASRFDTAAEAELDQVIQTVRAIRNARAQLRIEPARPIAASLEAPPDVADALRGEADSIRALARVEPLTISTDGGASSADNTVTLVAGKAVVRLPLAGVVDVAAERARLSAERQECAAALERVEALLAKPDFASKAPEEVVERERERLAGLRERRARLEEILAQLGG
ncbi:MAG: class I tRNA ligase family protein, partial [Chloroflexota bacterium]|nr:class I tRNA ligase family protein [Chloroflexota bacterium]